MDRNIAVLMATYNGEKYIKEQLDSIFFQKLLPGDKLTLFVRDDGSKDATLDIINVYSKNNDIIILKDAEKKIGPARSFWRLLKAAQDYDYYFFSDQDDIWDEDKVQHALTEASHYNGPFLYTSNNRKIDENGCCTKKRSATKMPVYDLQSVLVSSFAQGCSMMCNEEARKIALLQDEKYIPMHDLALLVSTIICGSVVYDLEPRFSHRIHMNNADAINKRNNNIVRLRKSIKKWVVRSTQTPLDQYVADILQNYGTYISERNSYEILSYMANYKRSITDKIRLLKWIVFENKYTSRNGKLNFACRIVLNLL